MKAVSKPRPITSKEKKDVEKRADARMTVKGKSYIIGIGGRDLDPI